jgi:hypothetical protein
MRPSPVLTSCVATGFVVKTGGALCNKILKSLALPLKAVQGAAIENRAKTRRTVLARFLSAAAFIACCASQFIWLWPAWLRRAFHGLAR